eukprot:12147204-Alexandrium_andersonii.AAC.1
MLLLPWRAASRPSRESLPGRVLRESFLAGAGVLRASSASALAEVVRSPGPGRGRRCFRRVSPLACFRPWRIFCRPRRGLA